MEIREIIQEKTILLNFNVATKEEFFKEISSYLKKNKIIENSEEFQKALKMREEVSNTGFGEGLAVPHGKSETVLTTSAAYIRLKEPIEWNSFDGEPVQNIFLFVINSKDSGDKYIDALASLSRKLMDEDFITTIKNSNSSEEILKVINKK